MIHYSNALILGIRHPSQDQFYIGIYSKNLYKILEVKTGERYRSIEPPLVICAIIYCHQTLILSSLCYDTKYSLGFILFHLEALFSFKVHVEQKRLLNNKISLFIIIFLFLNMFIC